MKENKADQYESPEVVRYGNVRELTRANTDGSFTDHDFPTNTPKGELTFSE